MIYKKDIAMDLEFAKIFDFGTYKDDHPLFSFGNEKELRELIKKNKYVLGKWFILRYCNGLIIRKDIDFGTYKDNHPLFSFGNKEALQDLIKKNKDVLGKFKDEA